MPENTMPLDAKRYLYLDAGLARVRGNKTIYRKMLDLFLQSTEFDSFEECLAEKDYDKAAQVAHGIKGMTGNLSLQALFEDSTRLMNQLRSGVLEEQDLAQYRETLKNTRIVVEETVKELGA